LLAGWVGWGVGGGGGGGGGPQGAELSDLDKNQKRCVCLEPKEERWDK
jgi:hypothetical protein